VHGALPARRDTRIKHAHVFVLKSHFVNVGVHDGAVLHLLLRYGCGEARAQEHSEHKSNCSAHGIPSFETAPQPEDTLSSAASQGKKGTTQDRPAGLTGVRGAA
jgi:hypothetical protein